jgi:DNA-binding NarL/FixJ family response regulator
MHAFLGMLDDIEVIGEAEDGQAVLEKLARAVEHDDLPDVIPMDLLMSRLDGIGATKAIKRLYPNVEVIALTSFSEAERVHLALDAGASGYMLKDADADQVGAAVHAAKLGQVHLDPVVARMLTRPKARQDTYSTLTTREREILTLLADGKSNRDIARALVISERTARTHVSNVLMKLNLSSRTQAALWAVRVGVAQDPNLRTP